MTIHVLMPCLDDATTAAELVKEVSGEIAAKGYACQFLIVDDGSFPPLEPCLRQNLPDPPAEVAILPLKGNLGHQRAIACGLCHLGRTVGSDDVVVVMDSDGEDLPADAARLVEELLRPGTTAPIVFAERKRRTEGLVFRIGYFCYLLLHHLLIGQAPRVGNFSALRSSRLPMLTCDSDLWSHYAGTVWKSRIPRGRLPVSRGTRRRGSSRLNLGGLILHGLAAISCYREILVLRAVIGGTLLLIVSAAFLIIAPAYGRWPSGLHPLIAGCAYFMLIQFCLAALWQCFNVMQNRHQATFIPSRDYVHFVPEQTILLGLPPAAAVVPATPIPTRHG